MKRASFGIVVVALAVACGDGGPASLTVTLDKLPDATNKAALVISGNITRVPAKKTTYVVTLTSGIVAKADTVDSAGHFSFSLALKADSINTFSVSATDEQHSTGPSVTATIAQDDTPPTIAKMTPDFAADLVPTSQTLSFVLSEPASATNVTLLRQGVDQPGTLTMAADSMNGTFVPAAPLAPNSIYTFFFVGLKDRAGNRDTVGACFVTRGAVVVSTDTSTSHFHGGSPGTSLVPPVIREARWGRDKGLFTGIIRFVANRSLLLSDANNAMVVVDLDIDQDASTGVKSYRDTALANLGPSVASGIGADYIIYMIPLDAGGNGGGLAARYTGVLQTDTNGAVGFLQDVCGPFFGFNVPMTALGNDDGKMDYSVFAEADDPTGEYAEIMPTKGPLTLDVSTAAGGTAPPVITPSRAAGALRRSAPSATLRPTRHPLTLRQGNRR